MKPLVSIIMGVYNEEKNLSRCIDSVLKQTYTNWEFIICNDCSTDNSKEILMQYHSKDERIIILENEKNSRLAASLNNCLKVAKGKYIARMDADDECLPDRLQKQVQFLEDNKGIDCVGTAVIVFDENGDKGVRLSKEKPNKNDLLSSNPFAHPTVMIRKTVMDNLDGYKETKETKRAEDLDLWFRFYDAGYQGYNMREPLYRYHESEEDMKKRSLNAAIGISKVYLNGYKLLGFPKYKFFYAIKPIIASLLPNKLMSLYHDRRLSD